MIRGKGDFWSEVRGQRSEVRGQRSEVAASSAGFAGDLGCGVFGRCRRLGVQRWVGISSSSGLVAVAKQSRRSMSKSRADCQRLPFVIRGSKEASINVPGERHEVPARGGRSEHVDFVFQLVSSLAQPTKHAPAQTMLDKRRAIQLLQCDVECQGLFPDSQLSASFLGQCRFKAGDLAS